MREGCIIVTYVDDAIVLAKNRSQVDYVLDGLRKLQFDFDEMGKLTNYLGIKIEDHGANGALKLSQPHLTERFIEMLGLKDSRAVYTPVTEPLGKCHDAPPISGEFNNPQLLVWQCISQTIHALTVPWPYISAHAFVPTLDCHTKRQSNASVGISKALSPRALSFNLPPPLNWIVSLMLILLVFGVLKTNKMLLQPALALVSS